MNEKSKKNKKVLNRILLPKLNHTHSPRTHVNKVNFFRRVAGTGKEKMQQALPPDSPAGGRDGEERRRTDGEKKEGSMEGRGLGEGCLEGEGSHRENLERWSAAVRLEVRSMEPIERLS